MPLRLLMPILIAAALAGCARTSPAPVVTPAHAPSSASPGAPVLGTAASGAAAGAAAGMPDESNQGSGKPSNAP